MWLEKFGQGFASLEIVCRNFHFFNQKNGNETNIFGWFRFERLKSVASFWCLEKEIIFVRGCLFFSPLPPLPFFWWEVWGGDITICPFKNSSVLLFQRQKAKKGRRTDIKMERKTPFYVSCSPFQVEVCSRTLVGSSGWAVRTLERNSFLSYV